jgi:hypothetical protein
MKFKVAKDINQPQQLVAQLFADPNNLKEYQEGFIRKEVISGIAGKDGTISKMYYKTNKYEMELTETIVSNKLPDTFEANYHHKNMDNAMRCSFIAMDDLTTRYEMECEYTAFRGFIPKILGLFFPKIFKKQVQKWMVNFKNFAEKQ